ncbi:TIGR02594 family protein [Eikenella sp. NML03-A-027]|uniref:NlpC/P60 family protein n=1 Tax=unclassified Eikenella TaxID=2639367 RepID=UPI0007DE82F1|nr:MULTISPECIES: TIGR02594 family protein [unclassified Eikenella]OAM28140.1 TIGR02594 family protein [Eikenella sp. NML01-A-086]OAM32545.1 TIGR02594 family protein [Eikenella sp. NML03-A-027]
MALQELPWIDEARKHLGLAEIPGKQHNKIIINWLIALGAWWRDDETPWCSTFVAHCCRTAGRDLPKHWYRAKGWLETGTRLSKPAYGCIVVFERQGGGHVGFVIGITKDGCLIVIGGNQGNRVSIAKFSRDRVIAYLWPNKGGKPAYPVAERYVLPVLSASGQVSRNEA